MVFPPHTFLSCSSVDPPCPAASFRRNTPIWALHRLQCLLGMSTCSSMELHELQHGHLLGCGLLWSAGKQPASPWAAEDISALAAGAPPPLLVSPQCQHHGSLLLFPSLLTTVQHFCALLNAVSLRCSPLT